MSNETPKSDTGVWVDSQTGQVVYEAPVEGVQLVPPGGELTPAVNAAIERGAEGRVVADIPVDVTDPDPEPEPVPEPEAVPDAEAVETDPEPDKAPVKAAAAKKAK